jgi:Cytosine/uracil/thiamine/allantoin permeases
VFLGNAIVLIPMIIQSHGGARYGLAEPQLTRSRWGVYGAMFPSWVRAVIGAGWWGIETYIMTEAAVGIYAIIAHKLGVIQGFVEKGIATVHIKFGVSNSLLDGLRHNNSTSITPTLLLTRT